MREDIPLQTAPGNYKPSWLRKNSGWFLLIAVAAVVMYLGAVVVTRLARPEPTSLDTQIVVSDALRVRSHPSRLHHVVDTRDQAIAKYFELRNDSDSPVALSISLRSRGTDFLRSNLETLIWSSAEYKTGVVRSGDEVQNFRCLLEPLEGMSPDGTIAAKSSAKIRLTYTNLGGSDQGGFSMLLFVSPAR